MDQEVTKSSEELTKSLVELLDWAKQSKEFVEEQAPLVVSEILYFEFWSTLALVGLFMTIAVLCVPIVLMCRKLIIGTKDDSLRYFLCVMGITLVPVLGIIMVIISLCSLYHIMFIIMAPRLFIIDYISKMI